MSKHPTDTEMSAKLIKATAATIIEQLTRALLHSDHEHKNVLMTVREIVEEPMIKTVMEFADHNQSVAAEILGINRATLRTKLQRHAMLNERALDQPFECDKCGTTTNTALVHMHEEGDDVICRECDEKTPARVYYTPGSYSTFHIEKA